jgi:aminocarboxymuconate-semialdehyde decarboxylase
MTPYGLIGTLFARGTVNSASLIALVEGEVFSQLPGLRVVVTAHAIGGLAMLAGLSGQSRLSGGTIEVLRRNVFIDTTLFHPAVIRASVDLVGAANVLAGSDFPIVGGPIRAPLVDAMRLAGLSSKEEAAITSANCLRLLSLTS